MHLSSYQQRPTRPKRARGTDAVYVGSCWPPREGNKEAVCFVPSGPETFPDARSPGVKSKPSTSPDLDGRAQPVNIGGGDRLTEWQSSPRLCRPGNQGPGSSNHLLEATQPVSSGNGLACSPVHLRGGGQCGAVGRAWALRQELCHPKAALGPAPARRRTVRANSLVVREQGSGREGFLPARCRGGPGKYSSCWGRGPRMESGLQGGPARSQGKSWHIQMAGWEGAPGRSSRGGVSSRGPRALEHRIPAATGASG